MFQHCTIFLVLLLGALAPLQASAAPGETIPRTLQQQAAAGNAQAQVKLALDLDKSQDATQRAKAVAWFRKAAEQGDPDGAWHLGLAYATGSGVARDVHTGLHWMRRGINDSPKRMIVYGTILGKSEKNAEGGNFAVAAKWYRKAAEAGSPMGMVFLAMGELSDHPDYPKNRADAERWMRKAAQSGDPRLESLFGGLLLTGTFGHHAPDQAVHWLRKAAQGGEAQAQGVLAYALVTGKFGVSKDPAQGVKWARKAIAQRNALGYYALGFAYRDGSGGLPRDAARSWYNFAAAQRTDIAHSLKHVAEHMSEAAATLSPTQRSQLREKVAKIPLPKQKDSFSFGSPIAQNQ